MSSMKSKKKGKSKGKSRNRAKASTRSLVTGSIPKPYMQVNASGGSLDQLSLTVSGMEVVAEVNSTIPFSPCFDRYINPADPSLFPRLSAIASVFDRFKMTRLVVRYHPGCNALVPGNVGLSILRDSNDQTPASIVELAEYGASAAGTCTLPLEARAVGREDDIFLLTENKTYGVVGATPVNNWNSLSRIFCVTDKGPSGGQVFYGFISLEFTFQFIGFRPQPRAILAGVTNSSARPTLSPGGGVPVALQPYWTTVRGWWDTYQQARELYRNWNTAAVSGTSYPRPAIDSSATVTRGAYQMSGTIVLDEDPSPKTKSASFAEWTRVVSKASPSDWTPGTWVDPAFRIPGMLYPDDEKRPTAPMADGDYKISLVGQRLSDWDADTIPPVTVIANTAGSDANVVSIPVSWNVLVPEGLYRFAVYVASAVSRPVQNSTFSMSVLEPIN